LTSTGSVPRGNRGELRSGVEEACGRDRPSWEGAAMPFALVVLSLAFAAILVVSGVFLIAFEESD
jgi:hypothetical protein